MLWQVPIQGHMTVAFLNKSSHARPESSQKTHFITSIDFSIFGHLIISASTAAGVNNVLHAAERFTAIKSQPGFVWGQAHCVFISKPLPSFEYTMFAEQFNDTD